MIENSLQHYLSLLMGGEFDHFLVAAIPSEDVKAARITLAGAGFGVGEDQMRHRSGGPFDQKEAYLNAFSEETSALGKFLHRLMSLTEEGQFAHQYREELSLGHDILGVRVMNRDEAEKVASLLACHNGHHMRYYGDWIIDDMSALGVKCPHR